MRRLPDTELIVLVREGSSDAAGVLFDRYWEFAWRSAYAVTADRSLADDAAQDAIQRAFAALPRFDTTRSFGPWLKRIAVNRAIDLLRRNGRLVALDDGMEESPARVPDDEAVWAVADAVAGLGTAKRLVVVLHYWLDLPLDEIAGVLGSERSGDLRPKTDKQGNCERELEPWEPGRHERAESWRKQSVVANGKREARWVEQLRKCRTQEHEGQSEPETERRSFQTLIRRCPCESTWKPPS